MMGRSVVGGGVVGGSMLGRGMLGGLALLALTAGCGDSDGGGTGGGGSGGGSGGEACVVDASYAPVIDPARFVQAIDNPLYPLIPGTVFTFAEGAATVTVEVTSETKTILGVTCTVVHDSKSEDGELVEDTLDWYAQDVDGAVWYFGEDTTEYEGGVAVSTEGSWEGGVDGAMPGIVMPAAPALGAGPYRQEYDACNAEDMGEVIGLSESITVPFGSFTGCLRTRDFSPLEPDVEENKVYCPDVGLVLAVDMVTGEREELTGVTP